MQTDHIFDKKCLINLTLTFCMLLESCLDIAVDHRHEVDNFE